MEEPEPPIERTATPLSMTRFEAFSDGVFAVAATLLVLDLKALDLKETSAAAVIAALLALWKPLLSYATSFLVVGVIWLNHHTLFHAIENINRPAIVLNLILLMIVALVPFPTALVAQHPESWPIVVAYGIVFVVIGIVYYALSRYVRSYYRVYDRIAVARHLVRRSNIRGAVWPVGYTLAVLLAPINTGISIAIYAAIPIFFLFPSPVEAALDGRARR